MLNNLILIIMNKINTKVQGLKEIAINGQTKLFEKTLKKM